MCAVRGQRQRWFLGLGSELNNGSGPRKGHDHLGHKLNLDSEELERSQVCLGLGLSRPPPSWHWPVLASALGWPPQSVGLFSYAVWQLLAQLHAQRGGWRAGCGGPRSPLAGVSRAMVLPTGEAAVPHSLHPTFVLCPCGMWAGVQPARGLRAESLVYTGPAELCPAMGVWQR